jgi:hypothetical protein
VHSNLEANLVRAPVAEPIRFSNAQSAAWLASFDCVTSNRSRFEMRQQMTRSRRTSSAQSSPRQTNGSFGTGDPERQRIKTIPKPRRLSGRSITSRTILRIPAIATTHSNGSRPTFPIDRDQGGAGVTAPLGDGCDVSPLWVGQGRREVVPVVNGRGPRATRRALQPARWRAREVPWQRPAQVGPRCTPNAVACCRRSDRWAGRDLTFGHSLGMQPQDVAYLPHGYSLSRHAPTPLQRGRGKTDSQITQRC